MVARTALVTDSTCNISSAQAAERHIYVAPLYILWGDAAYKDGVDITERSFFARLASATVLPKTSQVSPQDFVALYRQARQAEDADEIVCGVISSTLSGTYASAVQARDMVDFPVHVVDTRQVTWGLGFPMLAAAEARDKGAGPLDIVDVLQASAAHSLVLFTVDSLEYLHRGGRIGGASRLLGSALNIKPVLQVQDGAIIAADKVRTRKRAVEHMLSMIEDYAGGHAIERLAIIHGNAEEEAEALLDVARERFTPREAYASFITAVLGVHVGPGAIGVVVEWRD